MDIGNMTGPEFLVLYFFMIFMILLGAGIALTIARIQNKPVIKQMALLLAFVMVDGLGAYKLIVAINHGHYNVGFLLIMMLLTNFILLVLLLAPPPKPREPGKTYASSPSILGLWANSNRSTGKWHSTSSWSSDSVWSSGSTCSSGSSDNSGSSCSSSSCGGGGCGGCGGGS